MDYPSHLGTHLWPSQTDLPPSPHQHYHHDSDWFDVKVFYVRACSCLPDKAPDSLLIVYPQRSISTELDVNGCRICPSERACFTLRRDRLDTGAEEVTYVSTNNMRVRGVLPFEIYDRNEVIIHGTLGKENEEDDCVLCSSCPGKWSMECACSISSVSCHFLKGTVNFSAFNPCPCMEVYVTGRSCGLPLVLTSTVQLFLRKKLRFCSMDVIFEGDEDQLNQPLAQAQKADDNEAAFEHSSLAMDIVKGFHMPLREGYTDDGEEMDLSWFNAGVRVGVGIGLGLCLGVAIGVGLIVRPLKRRVL